MLYSVPVMREQVFQYLERVKNAVGSDQILRDVLNMRSLNRAAADRILDGILAQDPRFERDASGFWQVASGYRPEPPVGLSQRATLFIQCAGGQAGELHVRGAIHVAEKERAWEFALPDARSSESVREARAETEGRILAAWNPRDLKRWDQLLRRCALPAWEGTTIHIEALARRTLSRGLSLEDLSGHLGVSPADEDRPGAMAHYLDDCLSQLIELVPERARRSWVGFQQWIEAGEERIDFSRFAFGPELITRIPDSPGVYIMRNRAGGVLYVGKARNLKSRIGTYFTPRALRDAKVARIHQRLHSLEFVSTPSEIEALLLEMRLIRDLQPAINTQASVHERSPGYGRNDNLLVVVPERETGKAQAYFLCQGSFVGQLPVTLGREPGKRLTRKIRSVYFASRRSRKRAGEAWELELVHRWIAANRKHLNYVDVDEAGSFETVIRQVSDYLKDADLLSRKVYYR